MKLLKVVDVVQVALHMGKMVQYHGKETYGVTICMNQNEDIFLVKGKKILIYQFLSKISPLKCKT